MKVRKPENNLNTHEQALSPSIAILPEFIILFDNSTQVNKMYFYCFTQPTLHAARQSLRASPPSTSRDCSCLLLSNTWAGPSPTGSYRTGMYSASFPTLCFTVRFG